MDDQSEYKHLFPIPVLVDKGKNYYWCSCGESKTQPLCDKENCGAKSVCFSANLTEEVYFCNCKHTKNPPWCDGSHGKLLMEFMRNRSKPNT